MMSSNSTEIVSTSTKSSTLMPLTASSAGAAVVVERLAARQHQLAVEREQRQAQLQADSDSREDVNSFLASYRTDFAQLQQRCSSIKQATAGSTSTQQQQQQLDAAGKAALLEQLEALSVDVSSKEHAVSEASYFLPPYELRSCTSQLQQLRLQLADVKQQLQPKRKFAFSKAVARTAISDTAAAAAAASTAASMKAPTAASSAAPAPAAAGVTLPASPVHASTDSWGLLPAAAAVADGPAPPLSPQDEQLIAAGHGFAGLTGQVLVPSAQQLAGQGFVLHNLTRCDVFLLGRMPALRLQHLRGCRVFTGPVVGATFVDSCSDCTLMLASHQVRIHSASACEFYLRVRSRPIIEHSTNLAFAPYAAETLLLQEEPGGSHQQEQQHQQQQPAQAADCKQQQQEQGQQQRRQGGGVVDNWQPAKLLSAAQLLDDSGLWQRVDDFGWVKASASPHWGVLPECERQQPPQCLPDAAASEQ